MQKRTIKMYNIVVFILAAGTLVGSVVLLGRSFIHKDPINRTGVTVIESVNKSKPDTGVQDAGAIVDAVPENKRPTPEQLANEFLIFELRDLEKQAASPEDKLLMQQAIDLKIQRLKKYELSNDFNANMKKALK